MAIIELNSLIMLISGRWGNIVFYPRNGKQCIRRHVVPKNPDTEDQRAVRYTFADAVKSWQLLAEEEKAVFNKKALKLNMSGYNLYISGFMKKRVLQVEKQAREKNSSSVMLRFPSVSPSLLLRDCKLNAFEGINSRGEGQIRMHLQRAGT